ncbi:heavy-metal-associated domain-containing protein [Ramlibacter sp. MMS24-I3-19]|uniref:heavy-metal-associated domain-containing protein n=1 Tax=Ramlibacter sp. MMS24-I3-19 TaxID=3416606 RepID=UPI003D05777B
MVTFRISDMTCGHCASTIAGAVRAEDPAARLEFDIGEHLVRIASAALAGPALQAAIRAAGYSPMEVQGRPQPAAARGCGCGCGCGSTKAQALDVTQTAGPAKGGCCN